MMKVILNIIKKIAMTLITKMLKVEFIIIYLKRTYIIL